MQSISRHHIMSPVAQTVALKALEQLSKVTQKIIRIPVNELKTGKIAFANIGKHAFSYQGFDLYSLASDDDTVPTIWKKETVRDPKTGTEMEWLVAYTTDDDEMMQGVMSSQKIAATASANTALRAVAEPKLPKNQPPIAPGVINKNLTIDQGGQGGKATVTVEFNDPAKGESFFKQVEDLTSEVGGGATAPAPTAPKEEKPENNLPVTQGEVPLGGNEAKEPTPPTPTPAGAPLASTIKMLTHYGAKIVTIVAEQFEGYPERYHFVNEDGVKVALSLGSRVKVGSQIIRPDTNEKIRVIGYEIVQAKSDDDEILSKLGVDISDKVPPMGWTNRDSQNENDEAGNNPLPPNPALQENAPPTADTANKPPVYDSTQAEGEGTKQRFQMSVDPNSNAVTVKFVKPPALEDIDAAVQGQQPQLNGGVSPQPAQQQTPTGQQNQTQQKQDFSQTESPTQF